MKGVFIFLVFWHMVFFSKPVKAETVVTTYVIKTQEERENTRFTLTEWLKIKERMKMMDVWLAMFSDPKKDKFQPELDIWWRHSSGEAILKSKGIDDEKATLTGSLWNGQLWLTNLVSSTVGIRTLNIDFGLEGALKQTDKFEPDSAGEETNRTLERTQYAADFRLFGKNIQDSSLAFKVGKYEMKNTIIKIDPLEKTKFAGLLGAAELQLYLFKWLGIEGEYQKFGNQSSFSPTDGQSGYYYDYQAFVEISLLRLTVGKFAEYWTFQSENKEKIKTSESGLAAGAKILL